MATRKLLIFPRIVPLFVQDFFSTSLRDIFCDLLTFKVNVIRPDIFDRNLLK